VYPASSQHPNLAGGYICFFASAELFKQTTDAGVVVMMRRDAFSLIFNLPLSQEMNYM
jgi:hypothetical protein